ncbi:Eaa1 [Klebsiella pneumoniae]|nr:Eaa1 [Klebsiella pneumoniae]
MTKSTITREQLEEWVAQFDEDGGCDATDRQLEALIRQSLAAMDSKPVAWTWHYREQWHVTNDKCRAEFVATDGDVAVLPLYRHAQPAPISEPVFFIEVEGDDWINAGRIEGKNRPDLGLLPDGINYLYAAPQPLTDAEREELQERRKPLQDKDLQGVIDALEHPAGINAAGKQVVRHALVEIQERRKADSEPVATLDVQSRRPDGNKFALVFSSAAHKLPDDVYFLYRHAQPAPERDQVRIAHAEWSQATFGNVGPVGPLKHLSKEALEAAAEPGDLSEWADMQFLLWDAQRRAGITDEQITQAMIDKLAVNKQREWPEPKDGEPRLHIKEQPAPVAPVVPDFKKLARELVDNLVDCGGLDEGVKEKYLEWAEKTCRAAMLAATPQEVK